MARGGIFSEANNKYLADFNQRSRPKSPLITPVEKRRKNRGSGLGYIAASAASGLAGVFEGAADLVVGTAALFSGDKAYAQHVFEDSKVGEWKRNIDTSYNPGPFMNFTGQVAQGIGQSSTFLIPHVGAGLFFTGVIGGSTGEAVQKTGNLGLREYAYGTLSGATEGALEMLTGAGGQLARKLYGKTAATAGKAAFSKVSRWASSAAWRGVAKDMVSSAAGEFVEEFLGDYTDVFWSRVTGVDPEASTTLASAMYSGLIGAVSGGLMGGVGSAISVGQHYASGRRVIENGNVDAIVKTAEMVSESFKSEKDSKLPPALSDLKQTLKAYNNLADKTSSNAAIMLGRMKADIFYTQAYSGVQKTMDKIKTADMATFEKYAAYMSYQTGQTYSAMDFIQNKDQVMELYAIEAWSSLFLSDSRAQSDMAGFRAIIDADKAATAAQAAPVVRNISEAVNDSGEGWDGSDAVFKTQSDIRQIDRDYRRVVEKDITADGGATVTADGADNSAPGSEIGYIRVKKLGDDAYSIAWGANAENMRGFKSRTEAEVRRLLGQISKADSELVQSYKAFKAAKADTSAGESLSSDEIKKTYEKVIPFIDAMDSARASGAELNTGEVTYTAAEQDTARKAVKGFDTLDPDTRYAIMEWLRSASDLDIKTQRAVAQIIAVRPGLYVLSAELGEGHKGLYTDKLGEGRRLVVVDAKQAGDAVMQTITHELTHDLESTDGYSKLKKAALRGTSEARRLEIIDMYVKKCGAEQTYSDFLGDRTGTAETWDEYLKQYPQIDGEAISAEIVAKAVGDKLGKVGFIDKYASTNILSSGWNWLKRLYKSLKADRADELALGTTVKLGRAFEKALGQARSAKSGTGTAAYDIAESREDKEYRKPISVADVEVLRQIRRKSINDFTAEDIKKSQKWAYKFYQELGTKSPFFRAWFGEWRAYDDHSKIEFVVEKSDNRTDVINEDTKWKIQTSRKVHKETSNHSGSSEVNAVKYLPYIDDITKKAVLFDSEISDKDNPNSLMFHTMYAYTEVMGYPALLKLRVEELFYYDNKSSGELTRDYILQNIEEESVSKRNRLSKSNHSDGDSSAISISDLFNLVKTYDKNFSSAPEVSEYMLNKDDKTPKVFYHQTEGDFYVFDTERTGAGTRDNETPYGIFLKSSNRDIGLKGKRQMPLYAKMSNPLVAWNRADLIEKIKGMSSNYARLLKKSKEIDAKYKEKSDSARKAFVDFLEKNAKSPNRKSREELYNDPEFNRVYDEEINITEEWTEKASEVDALMKREITDTLKTNGFDGVILREDVGSYGRKTDAYIVLDKNQVKSATDNIGTFDSSNPDIRYDLDENAADNENRQKSAEKEKSEKKERDKAEAEEQKKAREKEETRQLFRMAVEDHSTKSKRAFFSVYAANATVEGLVKKAPLIAQIPEAADIIHRAFNLYEGDRAVEEAADSLKIAFTKKLFESRKRQKTKDSTLKDYNAKEGEISSYLKLAYKTHTTSRYVIYTAAAAQRMLRDALKNTLLIVPTNDGGLSVEGNAVRVDSNTMRRVARRLSELFSERSYTDAELDALSNKVVDYMLNSLVITNKELLESVAADMIGSTELISFFEQHMGRIKEDADISRRIEALKRSNSSHSRSVYERWVGKDSEATVTVGELMNSLREQFGISVEYTSDNTLGLLENLDEAYRREQAALRTTLTRTLVENYGLDPADIKNEIKSFYKDKGRLTNRDQAISDLERRLAEKNSIYEARLEAARDKLAEERQQYRDEKSAMKAVSRIISYARKIKDRMEGYNHTGVLAGPEFESLMKSASRVVSGNSFSPRGAVQFANDVLAFLRVASPEMMAMMEYIDKNNDVFAGLEEKYQQALEQGDTVSGFFADLVEPLLEIAELGSKDFSLENASMQVERSLTVNEMQTIAEAMQAVLRLEARHGRVFINGEWVDSMSYSDALMESSANRYNRVKDKIDKFFTSSMIIETIQPNLFAQIMEGTYGDGRGVLSALFGEIGKAAAKKDDDMLKLTADIRKFIDEGVEEGGRRLGGKEYKKHYEKDVIALTLKNPGQKEQRLSLTVGDAISFVATFKRAQARPTFALNAFEFKDVEGRGAGFLNRVAERIAVDQDVEPGTPEFDLIMDRMMNQIGKSVAEVEAQLTDGDRKLMQLGEAFFEKSKQIKMATDLILFGKTNIIAGYYFPILRSKLGRDMDYIGRGGLEYSESLRNFRWNKRTLRQANGRIVIDDYLSVINNHADQLTSYSNYSIPLQNLQRIVNGKTSITVKDCKTAREFISRYVYKEFDNYLKKYVTDVQGRRPIGTELTRKVERFLGRSVSNVLGLNISSMLKQLESAMLAMGYVSAPSWFGGFRPLNADKMTTYSTAARIRLNDSVLLSSHTGLRAVDRMDKIAGIGMITLRKGDTIVTQMLWSMCQLEVENKLGLQVGTEENYIKAGEKLDWLISMVQDTSDEASKSSLSRSDNRLMQMTTLFRNQPMKIWSQIVGCAWELSNLQSIRKSGGKVSDSESNRAKSRVCRLSAGLVASSVFGAAVSLMLSALRGNRDEDEPIAKTLASDTLGNILGIVPLAGQLAETLLSGYDAENFYYGVINDGLDTIESSYKLISDAASGKRVTTQQASSSIRKSLIFAGQMTGVPVRNAENIVKSFTHVFIPSAFYKYKSMFYSPTTADVKKAIDSGNTRMAETAMRQLMLYSKTGSRSNARVNSEMTRLYAAGYTNAVPRSTPVRTTVDGEGKSLTAKQTKQFEQIYHQADNAAAQLVSTADYAALTDEQKAKALRGIYDIYYSRAAHAVLGADLATASALSYFTDDVPELVTAAAYMSGLKTDSDGKRADKVRMYVSEYPTELQPVLLWAGGQRSASVKSRLSKLAEGLPEPERTAVTSALKIDT